MTVVLAIGDPHFKGDNGSETMTMDTRVCALIMDTRPEIVVVLGDILHCHEKLTMRPLHHANGFLIRIRKLLPPDAYLYVLIGNHDRANNKVFCTDEHAFEPLKLWPNTFVADAPLIHEFINRSGNKMKNVLLPYVEAGRFAEACEFIGLHNGKEYQMTGVSAVFAHQEFKGAKMNAITSHEGDEWPLTNPLCISGHIHDYHKLQHNLVYTGTPIQHGYADTVDKTVSLFTISHGTVDGSDEIFIQWIEDRHSLGIPRRIQVTLTVEEIVTFVPPPHTYVKIKLVGSPEQTRAALALPQIKALKESGVKIVCHDNTVSTTIHQVRPDPLVSYSTHLRSAIARATSDIQIEYQRLFT